jgi:hypothetical protein
MTNCINMSNFTSSADLVQILSGRSNLRDGVETSVLGFVRQGQLLLK